MDTAHACSDARHGTDPGAELLRLQRLWRERLLGGAGATRWRPGREIAAELLLHLDDEAACWHRAADWLRDLLDADRVDGGPGGFVDPAEGNRSYQPQAEMQREPGLLPTVLGLRFEATDPGLQAVWQRPEPCWSSATCQQPELQGDRAPARPLGLHHRPPDAPAAREVRRAFQRPADAAARPAGLRISHRGPAPPARPAAPRSPPPPPAPPARRPNPSRPTAGPGGPAR
ncbi:hypothetical protein ABIC99_002301 [Sphaerotilus sulfidivorans]|uniref:Uncharacterized protein n=1 Tax=Sphaerotilus sulfidivorans TaxID=639200 RepID=A0ABV2ING5_9BURK